MKKDQVSAKLVNLTQNLTTYSTDSDVQLDTIRRVIGYNLLRNRQTISLDRLHTTEFQSNPTKETVLEFGKYAVNKLSDDDKFIVKRFAGKENVPVVGLQTGEMRLPISINPVDTIGEWRWNQKTSERVGLFNAQNGLPIWADFYYFEDKLTVRSQNGNVPYFLFSKARQSIWLNIFRQNQTVALKTGHIWLLGKLFSSQAGTNDYVGFNIKEGSFTITNDKKWSGQFLDFKGNFSGTLTLKLVQPEKNAFDTEGCSAAQKIEFKYPDEVTFEWENGQLTKIIGNQGQFKGYGNNLTFDNMDLPLSYDTALNHVFIPCKASPQTWKADFSHSQLFAAEGEADIQSSFWALPIVRVTNPATLSEPDNNGGWALRLTPDLTARWKGSDEFQPNAIPTNILVLLYPKALLFYSDKTKVDTASSLEINQTFSCWNISPENTPRVPLHLNYKNEFHLIYYCHTSEGETLMAGCNGKMKPDRPVFAEGSLSNLNDLKGWAIFQAKGRELKISTLLQDADALKKQPKPYALENALMVVSQAAGVYLVGDLSNDNQNNIQSGTLTLVHGLLRWKPILPDPYVSNLRGGWDIREKLQGNQATSALYAQVRWDKPTNPIVTYAGELLNSISVGIKPSSKPEIRPLSANLNEKELDNLKKDADNRDKRLGKSKKDVFDDLERQLTGWKLLDVSTNMDLIGVSVGSNLFNNDTKFKATTAQNKVFVVKDLAVHTPLSVVHVFTLPQVQWEPVRTLPEHQNIAKLGWFPENLSSASDGGPTRLISISQELSPIIPEVVVRQVKSEFLKGKEAVALTTLSFGLKAAMKLTPNSVSEVKEVNELGKEIVKIRGRNADSFDIVRPEFPNKKMKGGTQINLMAESGMPYYDSPSPGFEGMMMQTLNGYELFTGTELGLSVLGATFEPDASVESQFNKEFAAGGRNPFVPVTRFDLSGYGASNFSEWGNPSALGQVSNVQFKIMVGRTAFEFVKFVSKSYPDGHTMTRSVTIERRSGGGVIRKDSGWEPLGPGLFDFRVNGLPQPYVFRPGLIKGYYNAKNIRPASNETIKFSDPSDSAKQVELAPIYFDADVQLEDPKNGNTFTTGILGFIQLSPKGETLSVAAFKKLINDQSAIGGPIDTTLNIGNSGFNFRATRFEVDVTDNSGTPNFVGILRGQPVLPNNGSWSVVKMAAPGNVTDPQEATSADVSRGTPLFIENTWNPSDLPPDNVMHVGYPLNPDPAGSYRFADPVDLFAVQPRFDYGFMQNTGSQAFLFRRPVIASGTKEISSSLKPAFADPFALSSTKGVFPPIANTIEISTSTYKLIIQNGTGKLRLNPSVNLNITRLPLLIAQDGTNQIAVEYGQSILRYELNENNWKAELDNFRVWTSIGDTQKLFGNRFSLRAGTQQQSKLVDVHSLINEDIWKKLSYIPGFNKEQKLNDIELGMTNAKHEVKTEIGFQAQFGLIEIAGWQVSLKLKGALAHGGFTTDGEKWNRASEAKLAVALEVKPKTFDIKLGLELSLIYSEKEKSKITGYVTTGGGGYLGIFKIFGYLTGGTVFVLTKPNAQLWLVRLEVTVKITEIISVGISGELQGYISGGDGFASGEVALNISIAFVIKIKHSYTYSETKKIGS